jgi:hypothetical protein
VAFGNANVAKALQPTDEQHQKKVAEIKEEAMKVLTSEQASQWQYMIGSPFRGEVHRGSWPASAGQRRFRPRIDSSACVALGI